MIKEKFLEYIVGKERWKRRALVCTGILAANALVLFGKYHERGILDLSYLSSRLDHYAQNLETRYSKKQKIVYNIEFKTNLFGTEKDKIRGIPYLSLIALDEDTKKRLWRTEVPFFYKAEVHNIGSDQISIKRGYEDTIINANTGEVLNILPFEDFLPPEFQETVINASYNKEEDKKFINQFKEYLLHIIIQEEKREMQKTGKK